MRRFRHSSFSENLQGASTVGEGSDPRPPASAPRPSSSGQPNAGRPPSAGPRPSQQNMPAPTLHDMSRIVSLFNPTSPDERKLYCAGYVWQRVELQPNGKPPAPKSPEAHWTKWYVQLSGGEMSLWSVEKMQQAVAEGRTVGPTFLKLTDVFVSAVDTKTIQPAGRPPPQCEWVFSLNNAASNRILFAPEEDKQTNQSTLDALKMWINCIRLSEWEIYKLNNIFTGTLLGLRGEQSQRSPLVKGRHEDWVQIRVPGDAEWRRAYLVVSDGHTPAKSKRRLSSFMSLSSQQSNNLNDQGHGGPSASFYATKRSKKPFLTYTNVTVAQAVFPEAEQLIPSTAVAKIEGFYYWDMSEFPEAPEGLHLKEKLQLAKLASGKGEDHATTLLMPDQESASQDRQGAMLAWVLAFADIFGLYGRKTPYFTIAWDPRNPESPYFAYPVGPTRSRLFFDVPLVVNLEPWSSSPSAIHKTFHDMLVQRMRQGPAKASPAPQQRGLPHQVQRPSQDQTPFHPAGQRQPPQQQPQQQQHQPQQPQQQKHLSQQQQQRPPALDTERSQPPQTRSEPPRLDPVFGSGSMDMDGYLARSPTTPAAAPEGSDRFQQPTPASKPAPDFTNGKPKLPALQTSDAALKPNRNPVNAADQTDVAASMLPYAQEPAPVARPAQQAQAQPSGSRGLPSQHEGPLPIPPDPAEAPREQAQKKYSVGPDTIPSAYSQPSAPDSPVNQPPFGEVKPLFSPQHGLPQDKPGSLGLVDKPEPSAETQSRAQKELPAQPQQPPTPSPALPIPGALPATELETPPKSHQASIQEDSVVPSVQPSESSHANHRMASPAHLPDTSARASPPSQHPKDSVLDPQPTKMHSEPDQPDLQRKVSSNGGHGFDDYASLALSYMNMEPEQQPSLVQEQQKTQTENQPERTSPSHLSQNLPALPQTATMSPTSPDRYDPPSRSNSTGKPPEVKIAPPKGPQPSTFAKAKADDRALAAESTKQSQQTRKLHKPGRPKTQAVDKRKSKLGGAWDSDEDSQESEEEESDGDRRPARSPPKPPRMSVQQSQQGSSTAKTSPNPDLKASTTSNIPATHLGHSQGGPSQHPERRASRTLPVPPGQTHPIERSNSSDNVPVMQRTASNSPERYMQPIPRSPSGMNRLSQLKLDDEDRPLSQHSSNRMSFLSQAYPSSTEFHQRSLPQQSQGSPRAYTQHPDDLTGVAGFNADGMLQAGLKNKHERSAKEREAMARESGAPLVDVGTTAEKQRDMQSGGMVAALAERERQRVRDGGQSAASRKQADSQFVQQQNQLGHGPSPSQSSGFYQPPYQQQGPQMMNSMFNPYMGMGMPNMGMQGMPGMQGGFNPHNFMMQQQAMYAAQQAYMNTMMAMSSPQMSSPGTPAMGSPPSPAMGHSPSMSMYGAPQGWGNPYMMGGSSMNMSGMFNQQQQPSGSMHQGHPSQQDQTQPQHAWSNDGGSHRGFSPAPQ